MIPNFRKIHDVKINDDGTVTAKYKPMFESVCYENDLGSYLDSFDPPTLSDQDLNVLLKFLED